MQRSHASGMPNGEEAFDSARKDSGANGLHAEAPSFVPGPSASNHLTSGNGQQSYHDYGMQDWSNGLDREAFVAGERAAMARSLQMMLPSQQALGMLSGGLQRLEAQMQEESNHNRQAAMASADAQATAHSLAERLNNLERIRLPAMESQIQHAIEAPLSQEFKATLQGLQGALNNVQSQSQGPYSLTGFLLRQIGSLGAAASMYTQAAISRADVAAIFLSRKILLDTRVISSEESQNGTSQSGVQSSSNLLTSYAKSATGAALFVALIEASWQFHSRVFGSVPRRLRKAVFPAQLGLKVLRIATWAATLMLSAVYFRRACYVVADTGVSSIDRAVRALYGRLPFCGPTLKAQASNTLSPAKTETDDLEGPPEDDSEMMDIKAYHAQAAKFSLPATQHPIHQPVERQRSVFDTPPPSPPPS